MHDESDAFARWCLERLACPRCGAPGVHIVHGYPTFEADEAAIAGDVVLGGCLVGDDDPEWACTACHQAF